MRKIIIAICGIIVAGGAMGARTVSFPNPVDNSVIEAWGVVDNSKYTKSVKGTFAPSWQYDTTAGTFGDASGSPREHCKSQNYPDKDWTYSGVGEYSSVGNGSDDEGGITPIIARKIYKHGGNFCMTQMQAGWTRHGDDRFFIDFFDDNRLAPNQTPLKRYKCETICEPGWCGARCDSNNCDTSSNCMANKDYTKILNDRNNGEFHLICGGEAGLITSDVNVFRYDNPKSGIDYNIDYVVLGVLNINKSWIEVAPVKVRAKGKKIINAYVASDTEYKILCAPGYELNDAGGCKLSSYCEQVAELCKGENLNLFNENKNHEWATKTTNDGETCKYITCKSGYGFKEGTQSKECEKCETTRIQGVNTDGICKKCDGPNQMFNGEECVGYKYTLYANILLNGMHNVGKCWLKSSPSEYKDCVLCQSGQTYDDEEKTCR
ncbi:MAG: hypothetical protein IJL21_00185 [Alphaproteobacteria bacterium]|nr:hypothetical protein [Alphaproteobacteria bacterium]